MLAKPGYSYLTIFYDNGHCPATVGTGKRPPVIGFRWLQRDSFATAQADYSRRGSRASLMLFLVASQLLYGSEFNSTGNTFETHLSP